MNDHPTRTSQDTASQLTRWEQLFSPRPLATNRSGSDVMLVSGPAQTFAEETAILLRSRLRAYSLICLVLLCFFFVLSLFTDNLLLLGIRFAILLVIAGCHAFVRSSRGPTAGQLRTVELVILFSTVVQLAMMMAARIIHLAQAGDPITLAAVQQGYMGAWVLLVLTYGLFIPIPRHRAAALLLPVGFVPGLLLYILAWARPDLASFFAKDQAPEFVVLPIAAAVVAVYAAHTIYRIRETAFAGRRFGQYLLSEQIGSGGMGQVFRADHLLLKRPCAIKVIRPDRRIDETTIGRFEAEVRATARLSHPNTVEIYDYGLAKDGTWYYVMELLRGMNFDELVQHHGPLLPERVVYLLRQACGSLGEAHAAGLVHRDIKPSNLFAAERGGVCDFVKVLDFGLVRASNTELAADEDSFGGSPHYMAPEQFSNFEAVDARSDIYALGAVAYFLLIGRPPFGGRWIKELRDAHLHQNVTRPSILRPSVPADLESVMMQCLAKTPADRFPSAESLAEALRACACADEWTQQQARQWWLEHPPRQRATQVRRRGDALVSVPFHGWPMLPDRCYTLQYASNSVQSGHHTRVNSLPDPPAAHPSVGSQPSRRWPRWTPAVGAIVGLVFGYFIWSYFDMSGIQPGDRAPPFTGTTQTGQQVSLSDYLGKQAVVLYFYPKDNTSVCTTQACAFRDAYEDFVQAGAVVIGVSSDSADSHRGFAEKRQLPFLLISDADGSLRKAFSVPRTLGLFPGRVTYVIDRQGIVRLVFNSQLNAGRHVTEALDMVRQLK